MQRFRRKQNILFTCVLIVELFATSAFPASAVNVDNMPSASTIMSDMEKRYHLDVGAIQSQGETFNVANNKTLAPEVSLFFSPTDPRPGEKLSAKAFPTYFSNQESTLYYTWYVKRKGCDLENNVGGGNLCDVDGDSDITVEDWKIEAMRILAQNGYDNTGVDYSSDSDDDGYRARFGGDNKVSSSHFCYVHDNLSGTTYELAGSDSAVSFDCPAGESPVCIVTSDVCSISGLPTCSDGAPICNLGSPRCVADPTTTTSCGTALTSCSSDTTNSADPFCQHLFPNATNAKSGDGSFGRNEEEFWKTNPNDPDTAENGNKDEANVVGLGQSTFTWNYAPGDEIGVAVEGASILPTKHDDASYMIMWAFPKKDCPISLAKDKGSYTTTIRDFGVVIPTVDMDLNKCIEKNLVNPAQGGQATNLEVSVSATPDNPMNDETPDKGGDIVVALASVSNAQHNVTDMLFDWKVEISNNIQFNNFKDITQALRADGLMGNTKGNALDSIRVKLDMPNSITDDFLNDGVGYLRFKSAVTEDFSGDAVRKGKSDVIVKFTSTGKKISAYKAGTMLVSGTRMATLTGAVGICNNDADSSALDRAACRVIKNEIIGLKVDNSSGDLANFYWTVNGAPLNCSFDKVSTDCLAGGEQNNVNFFPVPGNPGDTYTVTVTANNIKSDGTGTDNTLTLTRTFGIVAPEVSLEPMDKNIVWPKLLGQYKDITGNVGACPGGLCNDYSTSMFEAFSGSTPGFRATFVPGFLANTALKEWSLDGVPAAESAPGELNFIANKPAGGIYNIALIAQVKQSDETRRALLDIWGISPFDSPEINFSVTSQVQLQEPGLVDGLQSGPRKYLAAIVSYVPASVMFTFRIFLSAALTLFALGFLNALLQDRRAEVFVQPRST